MSTRLQHNMDKKAPAQRLSSLSPVALVVMGLVGAADALASVREALQQSHAAVDGTLSAKTTVMDYNAVASLVQALVREGVAPEEAALQVQFALQGPNPLAALSALVASVAEQAGAESAQDTVSLPALVDALSQHVAELTENGQPFDLAMLQDVVPASSGFAQADLTQALEAYKDLEQGVGAAQRGGNPEVAQSQIDLLLAQASQAGAAVATDAGAATAATATGAASGAAALGAMSAAQAIALVGLAAVAGGALDSGSSSAATTSDSSSGNVVKGPITGATVFRDLNGNYILDSGESSATTTTGGAYTLSGSGGKIVATGGTDSTTNLAFTGMLAAPAGATVVTPLTTLLAANSSLTAADLKAALGLTVDPLSFNPFATGVNAADALKAEGAAAQVNTILTSLAVTVNGASGGTVSLAEAVSAVANKLGAQVATQAATLKTNSAAGTLNLGSDALFTTLVSDVRTAVASKVTLSDSDFSTVVASAKATNATIADVVSSNGSLTTIANTLKSAQGTAPVANSSLLPDVTVAEDAALSGTGGTGSLTTLPSSFTATNIDRANLLKFFDNDSSTVGKAPTLTFDMTGYSVTDSGTSSLDLVVSLQKAAFAGRDLTVTLNDVKLDAATASGSTTLTLPSQTLSATLKMGSVALGTFSFSNVDSDALTLNSGSNTVGASPSFSLKLDSLFAKMTNGVGDVLDLTTLSNKALVALGGALVVGTLDDLTPASIVTKLKSLITLPASVDTVSELVTLAKNVVDFPEVSSLKISDLLGQIPSGSTKTLLLAAASRANVDVTSATSDTVSSALTKFSTAFGTYKLSDLSTLLSNGLGLEQGADIVSVAKELVVAALNQAEGLTAEQILDKAIGALIDVNNGDLRALLAGIDYQSILGSQTDALNVLNNIVQHGTVKYVDLINLGAHTLLSSDATMVVQVNDFKNLAVTSGSVAQTSLQVSVPIGSAATFTPPSNGLGIPTGAFTDADTADVLKYTATLESGAALPSWLTFNGLTKSFTGTPTNDHVGDLSIKITAIDPAGNTASDVFKLTVTNVNDAPQLVSGATTTATAVEFATASFDVAKAFKDIDVGDTLTYSAASGTTLPTGWTLSSAGVLSGTAPVNNTDSNATQTIKITATDKANASVTQDFVLTVTNDTTAPAKPALALERDNGTASSTDGITSNGTINVTGLETGATWAYSLTNGSTWALGSGTSFVVPVGTYAAQSVQVRQTDLAGNVSEVAKYTGALDIRTAPVTPTVSLATPDSGTTDDGVTNSGVVNVGQLLTSSGASWQYSVNSGSTWSSGTGSSFTLADGAYVANQVQVRQSDGNFESLYGKIAAAVTIDSAKPVLTLAAPTVNTSTGVFTYTFTSNEALTGFDLSDITVTGGVKGNALTTSDNKTFTLEVTPIASSAATATAADLIVAVAATAATDAAGNSLSAAASVANSILFGTSANQTITGTASADTIYGGGGTDIINAGAGNDAIMGGSGNDVISGGAGADKIDLRAGGADVLKLDAAADSPVTGSDTIAGFSSGDKIDLSAILKASTVGYVGDITSSALINSGSSTSSLQFKNVSALTYDATEGQTTLSADIFYSGTAPIDYFEFHLQEFGAMQLTFTNPIGWAGAATNGVFAYGRDWNTSPYSDVTKTTYNVVNGEKLTTVTLVLEGNVKSFLLAFAPDDSVTQTSVGYVQSDNSASTSLPAVASPVPVQVGQSSTAGWLVDGYLLPIEETGSALTTLGDNQLRFVQTSTGVDIQYDTNKSAGTTVPSSVIHLDGITGFDLTKTDFTFV